ncbi:MAG: hypothetical protein NT106_13070 [Candidatus Sumerlaeota bacterium]|nr:hypothetical protein [Candidatus Sumerlaeota bacterium]
MRNMIPFFILFVFSMIRSVAEAMERKRPVSACSQAEADGEYIFF